MKSVNSLILAAGRSESSMNNYSEYPRYLKREFDQYLQESARLNGTMELSAILRLAPCLLIGIRLNESKHDLSSVGVVRRLNVLGITTCQHVACQFSDLKGSSTQDFANNLPLCIVSAPIPKYSRLVKTSAVSCVLAESLLYQRLHASSHVTRVEEGCGLEARRLTFSYRFWFCREVVAAWIT